MLSCSIWFSAPSLWMGGDLESRCVGRVYDADGAVPSHGTIRTLHTTYAAALKITTHPQTRRRKPYAETQHLMLLMMDVCARNMSSYEYINKITLLRQVGISHCFTTIYCLSELQTSFLLPRRSAINLFLCH